MTFAHFVQLRQLEVCCNSKVSCICNCKGKIVGIICTAHFAQGIGEVVGSNTNDPNHPCFYFNRLHRHGFHAMSSNVGGLIS